MALIDLNLNPPRSQLRSFGLIGLVAFAGLGLWAFYRGSLGPIPLGESARTVSYVLFGLSAFSGIFALAFPPALKPLFIGMTIVAFPIGFVVSHVLMFALYYLVLTPMGLIGRLVGWDPMRRTLDKSAGSYWIKRDSQREARSYFRQY